MFTIVVNKSAPKVLRYPFLFFLDFIKKDKKKINVIIFINYSCIDEKLDKNENTTFRR